jgi:type IV secretion system protein VirD4
MTPTRRSVFDGRHAIAGASGFLGCGAAIFGSLWRARQRSNVTTYGSARWANGREIERAGLFRRAGVFLGRLGERYLRHDGPEHVMAFAPTRSGKGVGLVVPTLLGMVRIGRHPRHQGRELAADRRLAVALLALPAVQPDRRALGALQSAARGPPRRRRSARRPEHRRHSGRSRKARSSGAITGKRPATRCWSARSSTSSMRRRRRPSRGSRPSCPIPQRSFVATLRRMMTTNHLGTADAPRCIRSWHRPRASCSTRARMSARACCRPPCRSSASTAIRPSPPSPPLRIGGSPIWSKGEHPVSLYLVVPPSDISRTKPLIRLVLNQIGRRLTEHLHAETCLAAIAC